MIISHWRYLDQFVVLIRQVQKDERLDIDWQGEYSINRKFMFLLEWALGLDVELPHQV